MSEYKWTPAVTSSGRPCMFRSEVNEVVAALEAKLSKMEEQDEIHWKTRRKLLKDKEALEQRVEKLKAELKAIEGAKLSASLGAMGL